MLQTGLVIDSRYRDHDTGYGHPERAARIATLEEGLADYRRPGIRRLEPRLATTDELALVHRGDHLDRIAATAGCDGGAFDPDTPVSAHSYDTARLACGGLLALLDAIMAGEVDNGFALVRPPGHHAETDRAMGFCLFNNVAVGAEYLRQRHGLRRIAIMDWDVHHGNGSQHSFADDPGVLYVSTHQYPFYPGTGALHELGRGEGEGYSVNLPLPAGCGDAEYRGLFELIVEPICRQFEPDFVLISAGFDAHLRDPLGGMRLSTEGFGSLAHSLLRVAANHSDGRCAAVLEGGYDLDALGSSTLAVLDEMGGESLAEPRPAIPAPAELAATFAAVHGSYWELPAG